MPKPKIPEHQRMSAHMMPTDALTQFVNQLNNAGYQQGFEKGYEAGATHASREAVFTCYAAAAVAAHKYLGFGKNRIQRFIQAMDQIVIASIDDKDVVDQLEKETGYKLVFKGRDGSLEEVDDI